MSGTLGKHADKIKHFAVGAIATLAAGTLLTPETAFLVAVALGIGKEVYDHFNDGTVDPLDFIATAAGGACSALLHYFLN